MFICYRKRSNWKQQLTTVLRKLNAVLLAHGLTLIIGHVESSMNPTDGASRSLEAK